MYIGLPGRISQDALPKFLMSGVFLKALKQHFSELHFEDIEDGLVLCIDCFPSDSEITGEFRQTRRNRDTRVRDSTGRLVALPSLHSGSISVDHAGLMKCETQKEVAMFLCAEIERQAKALFNRQPRFDYTAFCSNIRSVALKAPD